MARTPRPAHPAPEPAPGHDPAALARETALMALASLHHRDAHFFQALADILQQGLQADLVCITQLERDGDQGTVLACAAPHPLSAPCPYGCAQLFGSRAAALPAQLVLSDDAHLSYPELSALAGWPVAALRTHTLHDPEGPALGQIWVAWRTHRADHPGDEMLTRLVGQRAHASLHRQTVDTVNQRMAETLVQQISELSVSKNRFKGLFDEMPLPAWRSDWTDAIPILQNWRIQGVAYFDRQIRDLSARRELLSHVELLDANRAARAFVEADALSDFWPKITARALPTYLETFVHTCHCLVDGVDHYAREVGLLGDDGKARDAILHWKLQLLPGLRGDVRREATVILHDITELRSRTVMLSNSQRRLAQQSESLLRLLQPQTMVPSQLSPVFQTMCREIGATLGVARVSVWLLQDPDQFVCVASLHEPDADPEQPLRLQRQEMPRYFNAIETSNLLVIHDFQQDERLVELRDYARHFRVGALLDASIYAGGQLAGVLCIEPVGETRDWTLEEINYATACANVASRALEEKQRRDAQQELAAYQAQLENLVRKRTEDLESTNADLNQALIALQETQSELVETEKLASLGSLVAGVAHELNTPIGNAVTVSTTLARHASNFNLEISQGQVRRSTLLSYVNNVQEASQLLQRSLEQAATLISNFKQVAVDQTTEKRRRFNLGQVVGEVVSTLLPGLRQQGHQLELMIPADLEMDSFPGPLGQVLMNVINNAVLHGFDKPDFRGTIKLHGQAMGTHGVRLQLEDNGRGMDAEVLSRIFQPFFTTKHGAGGSGLGMPLAYNIVSGILGGKTSVESQPGQFTRVTLELPLIAPKQPEKELAHGRQDAR